MLVAFFGDEQDSKNEMPANDPAVIAIPAFADDLINVLLDEFSRDMILIFFKVKYYAALLDDFSLATSKDNFL